MMRVGTDIEEIGRIKRLMQKPRFLTRFFSAKEIALFESRKLSAATVAGNFCAKEAFSKALGTGIRGFALSEVSVLRNSLGAPVLELSGRALAISKQMGLCFSVSISHCPLYATAVVIAYPEGSECAHF